MLQITTTKVYLNIRSTLPYKTSMLNIRKNRFLSRQFCTSYFNPYSILGVEKSDEITKIKKTYLKLIAKYHPDVNPSPDSEKMFKLVQDAFERIKELRGLSTRKSLIQNQFDKADDEDFKSVRPNPHQFNQNFEEFKEKYKNIDAKEYYYRLKNDPEFAKYAGTYNLKINF